MADGNKDSLAESGRLIEELRASIERVEKAVGELKYAISELYKQNDLLRRKLKEAEDERK